MKVLLPTVLLVVAVAAPAQDTVAERVKDLEARLGASTGAQRVLILNELAGIQVWRSPEAALGLAEEALALAREAGDARGEGLALKHTAVALMVTEREAESIPLLERAHELFVRAGDRSEEAKTLGYLGRLLSDRGRLWPGIEKMQAALAIFRELADEKGMAAATNNLGVAYLTAGEPHEALRFNLEALALEEKLGRKRGIANNLNSIGNIYASLDEQLKAREYYQRALELFNEVEDIANAGRAMSNIGLTYKNTGADVEALRWYERAMALARANGLRSNQADVAANIGVVLRRQNRLADALSSYREAAALLREIDDMPRIVSIEKNIAEVLLASGRPAEARAKLEAWLPNALETGSKEIIEAQYRALADAHAALGEYRKAFESLEKASDARQAMLDAERSRAIAELEERYQAEKRRAEIALLSRDNELLRRDADLRRLALERSRALGAALIALTLLLLGAAALLLRRYRYLLGFWRRRSQIGHYRILDTLGSGGMGIVYRAVDVVDSTRLVAVKVIREEHSEDPVVRRRFLNEAALVDQLDHPSIVRVVERGEADGRLFMAMELLEGTTLAALIATGRRLPLPACVHVMAQLAAVVAKIHERGIVHRDLKPDNVMLVERAGDDAFVKLLDFGLARTQTLTRLTQTGMIIGSINYLAPEQISEQAWTPASDVYSLGVTFFELATLEKPFLGETAVDVIRQILEKQPLPPSAFRPELPAALDRLILAMLDKRPAARPPAEDVLASLDLVAADPEPSLAR